MAARCMAWRCAVPSVGWSTGHRPGDCFRERIATNNRLLVLPPLIPSHFSHSLHRWSLFVAPRFTVLVCGCQGHVFSNNGSTAFAPFYSSSLFREPEQSHHEPSAPLPLPLPRHRRLAAVDLPLLPSGDGDGDGAGQDMSAGCSVWPNVCERVSLAPRTVGTVTSCVAHTLSRAKSGLRLPRPPLPPRDVRPRLPLPSPRHSQEVLPCSVHACQSEIQLTHP
ncbi:hypothetical protein BN1723_013363 [Verticillium longisporum]|uniref:Uncharacterized protein n=1 Tax=Verticillium longisporum TaxID=100787 RepID=A0A0G4LRK2_VERLO|nr:hypothetical protein BN1723_013363 [Verticillium longisporum]